MLYDTGGDKKMAHYTHKRTIPTGKDGDSSPCSAPCICRWQASFPTLGRHVCAGRQGALGSSASKSLSLTWIGNRGR